MPARRHSPFVAMPEHAFRLRRSVVAAVQWTGRRGDAYHRTFRIVQEELRDGSWGGGVYLDDVRPPVRLWPTNWVVVTHYHKRCVLSDEAFRLLFEPGRVEAGPDTGPTSLDPLVCLREGDAMAEATKVKVNANQKAALAVLVGKRFLALSGGTKRKVKVVTATGAAVKDTPPISPAVVDELAAKGLVAKAELAKGAEDGYSYFAVTAEGQAARKQK